MKAVTFEGPFQVEVKELPDPKIQEPTDAIIKVTTSAICGSDLHVYNGRLPIPLRGWIIGHEYIGTIQELGPAVSGFQVGDRVVGAFAASCGDCFYCQRGWSSVCLKQLTFGFGQLAGAQAQYLRVPFAHFTLEKLPASISDEAGVFIGDILPTGYFCAEQAAIQEGDVVAVVGCGAVGLSAQMCAQLFKPRAVIAIDSIPERLKLAQEIGSIPVNMAEEDPAAIVRQHTEGRGADAVLEAVGHADSVRSCFTYVRPGGTIFVAGVYSEAEFAFPMFRAFLRDLTFKIGMCPAKRYMAQLMPLVEQGRLDPTPIVSHIVGLEEAPRGYDIFANHKENCVKVLLKP